MGNNYNFEKFLKWTCIILFLRTDAMMKIIGERSSEKGRKGDALASGADEGRDKLRKASGSGKYALIRRYPNGETPHVNSV